MRAQGKWFSVRREAKQVDDAVRMAADVDRKKERDIYIYIEKAMLGALPVRHLLVVCTLGLVLWHVLM